MDSAINNQSQFKKTISIDLFDIIIVLSLINILYLNLKIIWFGTTGGTWFSIEPSTVLMPIITIFALLHVIRNPKIVSSKLAVSIIIFLLYAVIITLLNFNYSFYEFIFAFVDILYWACTFYLFYAYTLYKGYNNKIYKFAVFLFVLLLALFVYRFSFYKTSGGYAGKTLLLNNAYYILFLLPFMLLSKKKSWQYISFALTFIAIVISQKRGALLIVTLCFIIWFLYSKKSKSISTKIIDIIFIILFGVLTYYLLSYFTVAYDLSVTDRLMTLFNGEDMTGSGRNDIWAEYLQIIKNEGIISLFGRGYVANTSSPNYFYLTWAHNDFIQIMFDYGYIGAFLFLVFTVNIYKIWKKMKINRYKYSLLFFVSLLVVFINGMFSMCFVYPQWILMITVLWGILIGDFNKKLLEQ